MEFIRNTVYGPVFITDDEDELASDVGALIRDIKAGIDHDKSAGARKDDDGKLRYDLIPAVALEELANVYTIGAVNYGDRNWERGMAWGRIFGAIMRHLWAWWRGEDVDPETGITHLAHAAWGCFTLIVYQERGVGTDDREGLNRNAGN